tara:strand:- start:14178 stop:15368 length:1191 start_codon:yes stop_codon:yes gene_type:complete
MDNAVIEVLKKAKVNPKSCIEIGVRHGNTFKEIIKKYPDIAYYGIDPYKHYSDEEYDYAVASNVSQDKQDAIYTSTKKLFDKYDQTLIRVPSSVGINFVPQVDYIFVDGNHSYDAVLKDMCLYYPKLKPGGIMMVHDCKKEMPQVKRAVANSGIHGGKIYKGIWWFKKQRHIKPSNSINLVGLARTGHHAIMEWIIRNNAPSLYYNNCMANKYPQLAVSCVDGENVVETSIKELAGDYREKLANFNANIEIYDYMNVDVNRFRDMRPFETTYLVVRDVYNFLASCFVRKIHSTKKISLWKNHVRCAIQEECRSVDLVINYNAWCDDSIYRNKIAAAIGFNSDNGTHIKSKIGKSMFDSNNYDSRYKELFNNKEYWDLIDEECEDLNQTFFGFKVNR